MSSVGVVVFRNSPLGNANILQNNAINISNNDKKPKREIIIVRKKQKVQPQPTVSVTALVRAAEGAAPARALKRPRARDDAPEDDKVAPPLAVARRNARERNRVRQVNNGFAALRRHIPDEVAEAFETANSNRGPNKKLSKVETLRMAVEYIRNLESLLNIGESSNKENSARSAMDSFPSPASSSPRDNSFERSYFSLHSPALDDEEDEENDGPLPSSIRHQYARIHSEAFQLTGAPHLYDEDENGQPLTPASDLIVQEDLMSPQILDSNFHFMNSAEHFTVIHPEQHFGSEADVTFDEGASEMDVKYAETLRLSGVHTSLLADEAVLNSLDIVDPQLVIPQEQYRFSEDDVPAAVMHSEDSVELGLKQELPEVHVSPEDRQQFEETLKWWHEKIKGSHPLTVNSENND